MEYKVVLVDAPSDLSDDERRSWFQITLNAWAENGWVVQDIFGVQLFGYAYVVKAILVLSRKK